MSADIVSLRISRRALGVCVLSGDTLSLLDARHLTSRRERAVPTAVRFLERVLAQCTASVAVCDAPALDTPATSALVLKAIVDRLAERGLKTLVVSKADIAIAYGLPPSPTRAQVREIVEDYWPELTRVREPSRAYTSDAAAAALVGQCRLMLNRTPT